MVWQGLGFLVFVIALAVLALTQFAVNAMFDDPNYFSAHAWPLVVGGALAAALVFGMSALLERRQSRTVIDKATGEELELKPSHTLFFVPVKYWPYIVLTLTLVVAFTREPTA